PAPPAPTLSAPAGQPPTVSADDLPMATSNPRRTVPAATAAPVPTPRNRVVVAPPNPLKPARDSSGSATATQPSATAKPGCDPPWKIDANGIKQYKLDCL